MDLIDGLQLVPFEYFKDNFLLTVLFFPIHPEHLLSHLEQAKGASPSNQNDAEKAEKAAEAVPADQPVASDTASASTDSRRKARRGRKAKTAKVETPLVIDEEKDSAGKTEIKKMLSNFSAYTSVMMPLQKGLKSSRDKMEVFSLITKSASLQVLLVISEGLEGSTCSSHLHSSVVVCREPQVNTGCENCKKEQERKHPSSQEDKSFSVYLKFSLERALPSLKGCSNRKFHDVWSTDPSVMDWKGKKLEKGEMSLPVAGVWI